MNEYIVTFHSETDLDSATGLLIEGRIAANERVRAEDQTHARKVVADRLRGTDVEYRIGRIKSIRKIA